MEDDRDNWLPLVHDLVEDGRRRQVAFSNASRLLQDPDLKFLFMSYSFQRSRFVEALREALAEGKNRIPSGSRGISGAVKEGLDEIKLKLGPHNDGRILQVMIDEEERILTGYKRALDAPLPEPVRRVVASQFDEIQATYCRLTEIRQISSAPT